ncbi:MAG: ABC transporter substrate-binding protein [Chloroflexi bacterium]|nr:ABC transporter substrate-binding protein [Chloroflexota bacterium]
MKRSSWLISKCLPPIILVFLFAFTFGCSQPPPTPTPIQAPKAAPTKEAKPEAKDTKPAKAAPKEAAKEEKKFTKLKVPYSALTGARTALWVTKEKGLFEKYDLDVDVPYVASGTTLTQALLGKDVNLADTGGGGVVNANLAGADLVLISAAGDVLVMSLYSVPGIQRVEDLKGKVIGVTRFGSNTDFTARYTLKKFGMEPDKDVAIVETGGTPEAMAALQTGGVHGAIFAPPNTLKAKALGMRELVNITDLRVPYLNNAIAVSKEYLSANPEVVKNFLKAYLEGIAVAKKDKAFAMKVIGQYTKTEDKDVLEETYDIYINKLLQRVPYVSAESVQGILDEAARSNANAKNAKPESLIDNTLLKELEDSGFVKKLYEN